MSLRVAVIGAGVTGLVAAHRLAAAGHRPEVFELRPELGGRAATIDVGGGVLIERCCHRCPASDGPTRALYDELGMGADIEWGPSPVGMWAGDRLWPFASPRDLLRFRALPLRARVRMRRAVRRMQREDHDAAAFEQITAREWVAGTMGRPAWDRVWGPLLGGRFGDRADDIDAAWLWNQLSVGRQVPGDERGQARVGYPRGSFEGLYEALAEEIEANGGAVHADRPAQRVNRREPGGFWVWPGAPGSFGHGLDPREFPVDAIQPEHFDAVLATVSNDLFELLLDDDLLASLAPGYAGMLRSVEYRTALCLLLETDRQLSPYHRTSVADPEIPFAGVVEQTNLVDPERYGGRRFLYVTSHLEPDDELLALDPDELIDAYADGLRRINPGFGPGWIRGRWLSWEPAAQPVVTVGYRDRIPPLDTGVPGLVLANITQVPDDRGVDSSVRLGDRVAAALLEGAITPVAG